ncbi:TetR/AcrR family transcriptional regulator [Actinophytocola xanthii]|uniref:TetR family transcriptional regulator n=1 Tax=Actinophytocola xanthii TaxID=1912961 RepID=A0A1Q8C7P4_9PSEU|nr:TetR/AcrR family transcriptional regulator [Actinophytocola xanthii]OLF10333.1 TetR family transcriptional regulator [Actinophytocola xanthii]
MSPRRRDPAARVELVQIAARLLAEEGPESLSARRITSEAGTSTMAVYTHFGSMSGLVREIVHEGFSRLERAFSQIAESDDPVADLAAFGRAYRRTAVDNPDLYSVMFGGRTLAGFRLTEEDRQYGRFTLSRVVECARSCVEAGRFRDVEPELVAHHMWLAVHGLVTMEIGEYLVDPCGPDRCFETQLVTLMVGAGDSTAAAEASVRASVRASKPASAPASAEVSGRARQATPAG